MDHPDRPHACICGRSYYDSDGGPCHDFCAKCGDGFDVDDLNDDCICEDCEESAK